MSCVVPPTRSAACCSFALLFGAVTVIGMSGHAAFARDEARAAAPSWCVARSNQQPDCAYDNLVTCGLNAMLKGGHCVKAEWSAKPTATAEAGPQRQRRKVARRNLSGASQNDKLFKEFERWKETAPK
jgi:hypothetical protein